MSWLPNNPRWLTDAARHEQTVNALEEEIDKLKKELKQVAPKHAYWKTREKHNDYLWVECSNCGFRVENYKAVKMGISDIDIIGNKWNGCPMCCAIMDGERNV